MKKGAGALSLAVLGAVFVPSWPVQLICWISVALTLFSLAYSRLARQSLRVERDDVELKAHPHTRVRVGLTVRNTSFLPLTYVGIVDRQGGLRAVEPPQTLLTIPPRGRVRFEYTVKTMGRGVHDLGPATLMSSDPLGLFPWRTTALERCRVTVLPEVGVIHPGLHRGSPGGDALARDPVYEDTSRFRAVREYVSGDPPPRIHWKTTARLGSLHTVEYEPAIACPCLVVLELGLEGYPLRSRYHFVERAIETAATLVLEAARDRQATGLVTNGQRDAGEGVVAPGKGMAHALHILSLLAGISAVDEPPRSALDLYAAAIRPPPGSRVCFVGPLPPRAFLEQLKGRGSTRPELYRIYTGPDDGGVIAGVRAWTIRTYGEVLAGD